MSLIEEALRQVQEMPRPPASAPRPSAPSSRAPIGGSTSQPTSSRSDAGMPAAVIASLAVVGLVSVVWQASMWWQARTVPTGTAARPAQGPRPMFSIPSKPAVPRTAVSMPAFVLSGIMDQGGEKVAVVNNTIVQAGDLVDGARVLEVRSDSVYLRAKNQDVILKTSR